MKFASLILKDKVSGKARNSRTRPEITGKARSSRGGQQFEAMSESPGKASNSRGASNSSQGGPAIPGNLAVSGQKTDCSLGHKGRQGGRDIPYKASYIH